MRNLERPEDNNLLVGLESSDDAAVYKINDELAIIQTLDFFTPIVDDPYMFGQIAAANALSDVYAMGGEPVIALNIVCFPASLKPEILGEILRGGQDKVKEAGALLVGGHSVSDDEPKYGLSVTGFVHPDKVMANNTAEAGDVLILTKPLGVGIINSAIKANKASESAKNKAIESMSTLNLFGKKAIEGVEGVHSITDITGFGLIGHAVEMGEGSKLTLEIDSNKIPYIKEAEDYAKQKLVPGGAKKNKEHFKDRFEIKETVPDYIADIIYDPQTSGGLLISVSEKTAGTVMKNLESSNLAYAIIGKVKEYSGVNVSII